MLHRCFMAVLCTSGLLSACVPAADTGFTESPPAPLGTAAQAEKASVSAVEWALDEWLPVEGTSAQRLAIPSLTQPYYNNVLDVHATLSAASAELILSTNGNWHSALRRLLGEQYFPAHPTVEASYLVTTSPPISLAQLQTGRVKVGNVLYTQARPHVVVAPGAELNGLQAAGYLSGPRLNVIRTYGSVLLRRRGDDKVGSFWDLRKIKAGRFASSDPSEGGSFTTYRDSVYNIALNNPREPGLTPAEVTQEAADLRAQLFDEAGVVTIGPPMHRSVPHSIAVGNADVGLFFLHLAVTAMRENPDVFEAVYLAGDHVGVTADPDVLAQGQTPLVGNGVGIFAVSRTNIPANAAQVIAREDVITALQSPAFTQILAESGLRRP
jgi:hypothetical protein